MKKESWKIWLIGMLVLVFLLNAVLLVKYAFPPIVQLNKTYSSTNGLEEGFRNEVIALLNQKIQIPKDYTFYFDKKVHGGEFQRSLYVMYLHWKDEEGFDYLIEVESDERLNKIVKLNPRITKNSDYGLSFKDYIPNNYFNYGGNGFDFPQNNYLKEESLALKEIRQDVNHITLNINNLRIKYVAIPGITILSTLPNQDFGVVKTKVDAVAVISKSGRDYVYEYDYNGDGKLDETKRFNELQDPLDIVKFLANRLKLNYTLVDKGLPKNAPGQNQKFESAFNRIEIEGHTTWESNDLRAFIEYETDDGWIVTVTPDSETEKSEFWVGPFIKQD